ncbi:hypothetical protein DRO64_03895 [Candidatus Bathyarchaeota archaeon]|nr:MAG: hypothetical protein DRO64_03895 [Candidatus Bathyarchaeota archaeon]
MDMRSSSGISPVVATVILVAIAIVIAIAVAFWASGLVGVFTRFEKVEIAAAYWDGANVIVLAKNTGSAIATIDDIYINGKPHGVAGFTITFGDPPSGTACDHDGYATCEPGEAVQITVSGSFERGVTYEISVHTASGKLYPVSVLIT